MNVSTRRPVRYAVLLSVSALFSLASSVAGWEREEWETPWPSVNVGGIGIDTNGSTHIVYQRDCDVYYRTNASGTWANQKVRATSDTVACNNLFDVAFAPDGTYYFLYREDRFTASYRYKVATNRSGSLQTRVAIADRHNPSVSEASVAARGALVRVAYATTAGALWLRTIDLEGSASERRLGEPACCYSWPDVAIDGDGKLHVVAGLGGVDVVYVTNRAGSWRQRTVSLTGSDSFPQIALQPNGSAHVAWWRCSLCNESEEDAVSIIYATNRTGAWRRTSVASVDRWTGGFNAASIAYSGGVHLAWGATIYGTGDAIRYATNVGGSWTKKTWVYPYDLNNYEETLVVAGTHDVTAFRSRPHLLYSLEWTLRNPVEARLGIRRN